ncbi:phosphoribosylformylglycinamidine synthase [Sulfodiicoccus acidiphilus]|uniref:Phosphoribosylformylglycinamidine synthase subunit PurL n=2 Tax=Sulfodiicoccus acidiphilus TaxID=1670455 RepID=A0A830GXQ0_9CREN|nr:phosphoribosylformylglycinamidine synthase [Sulfodiicoccus acidiphilus]
MGVEEWGDAGAFRLNDGTIVVLKLESHNHPSALDPFNGAATGVGGVIRDVLSVGARPVALLDMLRVGSLRRERNRELLRGIVRGVGFYGNSVGVPVVGGELSFDDCYDSNPLVDVACVGVATTALKSKTLAPGDRLVIVGSTGIDGIGGASFASRSLSGDDERGAVQIADPFSGKIVLDVTLRSLQLVHAVKDLGAGGIGVAVAELAGEIGALVKLDSVPTRVSNMSPEEILVSETQERMLYSVEPDKVEAFCLQFKRLDYPCVEIGVVTGDSTLRFTYFGDTLVSLPSKVLSYVPRVPWKMGKRIKRSSTVERRPTLQEAVLAVMSHEDFADKEWVYSQYDYEVLASTVIKPGWADAAVVKLPNGAFLALKGDANPELCNWDSYKCAKAIFAEAYRNLSSVGARPRAAVDHLQFGSPVNPTVYADFVDAVNGLAEASRFFNVPIVGGKVSFYNDTPDGFPIKPTPLVVMAGTLESPPQRYRISLGDQLLLVGFTRSELGGSLYHRLFGGSWEVPDPVLVEDLRSSELISSWVAAGLVKYVKDVSKGGLLGSLFPLFKEGLGAKIELERVPCDSEDPIVKLFSETSGRFLVVGSEELVSSAQDQGILASYIGEVADGPVLNLSGLKVELTELISRQLNYLERVME